MSGRSIHIADFGRAVADGTIPGAFASEARARFEFPTVESVNSRGAALVWNLRVHLEDAEGAPVPFTDALLAPRSPAPAGLRGVITRESWQVSAAGLRGKTRDAQPTFVAAGKNLGKANETNPATQALRDALGLYNAQKKRGAGKAPGTAASKAGLLGELPRASAAAAASDDAGPPPMLVKRIGETKGATFTPATFAAGVTAQRKFDGVRAPAYLAEGRGVVFYSRTKRVYPGLAGLRADVRAILEAAPAVPAELDPGGAHAGATAHLDGELYIHGKTLREISGQARREDDSDTLQYVVYDCFFPAAKAAGHDLPSAARQAYLDLVFATPAARARPRVRRAENFAASTTAELFALSARFVGEGYEGAIARKDGAGYRYGHNNYHSDNLVKIKPLYDAEFPVVGFTEGTRGKDVGALIWVCEVDPEHVLRPADKTFAVVPKNMTYARRRELFLLLGARPAGAGGPTRFARDFAGRPLTVEFPGRSSKTGKPLQAKALGFRSDEPGDVDPLEGLSARELG